jgi:hypothetical protein
MSQAAPFDAARLIADVRKGDQEALARAYKATFDHALGRLVLADFLASHGVGRPYGAGASVGELRYACGQQDAALELARRAGFDAASIAVATMTDQLEGTTDDPAFNHAEPQGYTPGLDEAF